MQMTSSQENCTPIELVDLDEALAEYLAQQIDEVTTATESFTINYAIPEHMVPLYAEQMAQELRLKEQAEAKRLEQVRKLEAKGRLGDSKAADGMINWALTDVIDMVQNWIAESEAYSQRGKPSLGAQILHRFVALRDTGALAEFVASALGSCFNGITKGGDKGLTSICFDIGRRAENLIEMAAVREEDKKLHKRMLAAMQSKGEERKRRDVLSFTLRVNNITTKPWPEQEKVQVGRLFIDMVIDKTGYFEFCAQKKKGEEATAKRMYTLALSTKGQAALMKGHLRWIEQAITYEPMIVPPVPWCAGVLTDGGYLTHGNLPLSIVKTPIKAFMQHSGAHSDLSNAFLDGLNGAQNTGWRIRKSHLQIIKRMMRNQEGFGVLPALKEIEPHRKPANIEQAKKLLAPWDAGEHGDRNVWIAANLLPHEQQIVAEFNEWKAKEKRRHEENMKIKSRQVVLCQNVATATRLKDRDSIYLPHHVDFRSRVYALTNGGLSPQGEDYVKGLLEFDIGLPLGREGWYWLRWHTANVWGEDKLKHENRVKWTDENMGMIRRCAQEPLEHKNWMDADKPWQFLAACMEVNAAMELEDRGESALSFESRIPIALDGSCSGLQHLGMATRCAVTGRAVNLLPSEMPCDIYQIVADKVEIELRMVASGELRLKQESFPTKIKVAPKRPPKQKTDEQLASAKVKAEAYAAKVKADEDQAKTTNDAWMVQANAWIKWGGAWRNGKLSRSITKRPVMTYPYGAKESGYREQILEDTLDPAYQSALLGRDKEYLWFDAGARQQAAHLMAHLVWRAVVDTVQIPAQIMEWLQAMARLIAKGGAPVQWTTPLGFPVTQMYMKKDPRKVDGVLYGRDRVQIRYNADSPNVDVHKQVNGIAPNIVHSLDGTHLLMTVAAAVKDQFESYTVNVGGEERPRRRVKEEGIKHFALIHDSFGTHAANTSRLLKIVKEQMVVLYSGHYFYDLMTELAAQVPEELQHLIKYDEQTVDGADKHMEYRLPKLGNMDISELLKSEYAFA